VEPLLRSTITSSAKTWTVQRIYSQATFLRERNLRQNGQGVLLLPKLLLFIIKEHKTLMFLQTDTHKPVLIYLMIPLMLRIV